MGAIQHQQKPAIERFGLEAVPEHLRTTSGLEYMMIQISISVNAGNFLVPAIAVLEGGLSFYYAILATVIGASAAFVFVSFLALPGVKYGIPAQYAIRTMVGTKGSRFIASPVRTVTSLYWFSVQTIGGTYLLKEIIERVTPVQVPFVPLALLMALFMAILALVGFGAVKKVTKYFLPFLFLGGIVMLYLLTTATVDGMNFSDVWRKEGDNQFSTMLFFASLAFVQYISGVSAASDMARYAKSPNHGFYGLLCGNIFGFILTATLGAYTAALAGSLNPYVISSQLTESPFLISLIFIAAMASMIMINLSNAYTGGYSLLNSIPVLGRVGSAVVFGIIAITLSAFPSLVADAKIYISYLGALTIPLSAVIVADFLFLKKRTLTETDFHHLETGQFTYNKRGLVAILAGTAIYLLLPESLSPGFITFISVFLFYLLLSE